MCSSSAWHASQRTPRPPVASGLGERLAGLVGARAGRRRRERALLLPLLDRDVLLPALEAAERRVAPACRANTLG